MGESPALHISGSHHPALSENANQYKAAQSQLLTYLGYTNTFRAVMQAPFFPIDELKWVCYGKDQKGSVKFYDF